MRQIEPRRRSHVNGKDTFQRRPVIAARAITLGAADNQQAAAQIPDILFDVFHLCIGKLKSGDVVQDHQVKGRKLRERQRVCLRRRFHHRIPLNLQHAREKALAFLLRGKQQNPGRSLHLDHPLQQVVFRQRVVPSLDQQFISMAAALLQALAKIHLVGSGLQLNLLLSCQDAVAEKFDSRRRITKALDLAFDFKALCAVHTPRAEQDR